MQNIPNGGRPLRFIRLARPVVHQPVRLPAIKPAESYQEVTIPEIPCDKK
jgi:hypothetical protein